MNNNVIKNPKVEVPVGISLNDKDYLNILLSCLKEMARNYTMAMEEVSNEKLYELYKNIFLEIISLQREAFQLAFRKGWYVLEKMDLEKINNKYQTLLTEYQDLNG